MEQHLKQEGLLHTLVNTVADESYAQPTPGATTQQENDRQTKLAKRNKEEDAAINELWMALNDESMSHVMQLQSAKAIMEKLQEVYQPQGAVAMISLRSKLYLLSNKRFQSLKDLFAAHHELVRQLESMGEAVDHMEQIRTLLVAIPEQFKHLLGALSVIRKQELQTMSLEQIKRIFLDADETIGKDAGVSQAAFIGHNRETKKKNQGGKPFRSEHPKKNMVCFECGKVGHKRRNCFQLKKKVNQGRVSSEENLAAAVSNVALMSQVVVSAMDTEEPIAKTESPKAIVRAMEVDRKNGFKVKIPLERINMMRVKQIQDENDTRDRRVRELPLHELPVTLPMYVDSGASAHMLREMRYFNNLWEANEQTIAMANGEKLKCNRVGNAVLQSDVGNKRFRLTLYNAYFIPELHCNLISVSKMEETGKRITFRDGQVEIWDESGQMIAKGRKVNGLYALDVSPEDNTVCANLGQISSNVDIWHKRFAHLGDDEVSSKSYGRRARHKT